MENYSRSRSYSDGRNSNYNNMQLEVYGRPSVSSYSSYDFRTYSTSSYAPSSSSSSVDLPAVPNPNGLQLKKAKSFSAGVLGFMNDPELQRKKRVAGYKVYGVKGKVKGSFRNSFRWIKDKYTQVVYG